MAERTLIIIKPDGIQRLLAGRIISRLEERGFKLVAAKFTHISEELAKKLYKVHSDKPFLKGLVKFISSSPSLVMVWEADGIIEIVRKMMGATFGCEAEAGTIRGDLSCGKRYNLIHGSDSPESARYEISVFFGPDEIVDYELTNAHWIYGVND
ncbi:MAG: nucleoside-diphosphate kinase [Sedimentisphaerales bacterium]|nr:nucleoside-diphosphate kinase [Sedimentisphaerales bacterium]